MPKYKVEITETLQKIVEVEAETIQDAVKDVQHQRDLGMIVLTADDYIDYSITVYKED